MLLPLFVISCCSAAGSSSSPSVARATSSSSSSSSASLVWPLPAQMVSSGPRDLVLSPNITIAFENAQSRTLLMARGVARFEALLRKQASGGSGGYGGRGFRLPNSAQGDNMVSSRWIWWQRMPQTLRRCGAAASMSCWRGDEELYGMSRTMSLMVRA